MKLPVNLFLYTVSTGLLGLAGYTLYLSMHDASPEVNKREYEKGIAEAEDLLARGKGQRPESSTVVYDPARWGASFSAPNLTGKEPPKPQAGPTEDVVPAVKVTDRRPIDEIIEILTLVYDSTQGDAGGQSHIVVRYREGADVQPPRWYLLENQNNAAAATPAPGPTDTVGPRGRPNVRGAQVRPPAGPATTMPTSSAGREVLQELWVHAETTKGDADSPRNGDRLWPPFDDIRLVRVAADARSAYFERAAPPPAANPAGPDGVVAAAAKPAEEEVFVSAMDLSPDVKRAVAEIGRREAGRVGKAPSSTAPAKGEGWQDVEETRKVGDIWHISRRDQTTMRDNPETLLDRVNLDAWVSRTGSGLRGLRVLNIAPEVATRFGVQQGDLLLSVNNEAVSTKAEAIQVGRRQYNRGVRTFVLKFLSDGRPVERTYQAPDR